jgi:hypothetical protein
MADVKDVEVACSLLMAALVKDGTTLSLEMPDKLSALHCVRLRAWFVLNRIFVYSLSEANEDTMVNDGEESKVVIERSLS